MLIFGDSLNNSFPGECTSCLALQFIMDGYLLMEELLLSCTSRRTNERITNFCLLFAIVSVTSSNYCWMPIGIFMSKG